MQTFLWLSSSVIMLILLALLALRAFDELLGVDLMAVVRKNTFLSHLSPGKWPWPVLFIASLAVLYLGAWLAYLTLHRSEGFSPYFWRRFTEAGDAPHYLFLAQNGYVRTLEEINKIVFFPLFPMLMGALGRLFGGRYEVAGMLISQVCYGASVIVLRKLAQMDCKHPGTVILMYCLYPFGFFCLGVYTEGLFLLLSILGLYCIRTRRWLLAGLIGFLCSLTRTQGVLLLLPAIYCAWQEYRERGWNWRYLALLGSVAGYVVYLIINKVVCGDFFAYLYYESISPWWQSAQWIGDTVAQQWGMALERPGLAKWIYWPQLLLYFIVAAFLLIGYRKKMKTSYILYGTAYLGMCYTPSLLISGGRYLFGCVPLYLSAGQIENRAVRSSIIVLELIAFWVFFCWYMQGQAIM